jgi:VanZ family protein
LTDSDTSPDAGVPDEIAAPVTVRTDIRRAPWWLAPVAFMALLWFISDQPWQPDETRDDLRANLLRHPWDKVTHACGYAMLAWLWCRAFASRGTPGWWWKAQAFIYCGFFGMVDEFHQSFVCYYCHVGAPLSSTHWTSNTCQNYVPSFLFFTHSALSGHFENGISF